MEQLNLLKGTSRPFLVQKSTGVVKIDGAYIVDENVLLKLWDKRQSGKVNKLLWTVLHTNLLNICNNLLKKYNHYKQLAMQLLSCLQGWNWQADSWEIRFSDILDTQKADCHVLLLQ